MAELEIDLNRSFEFDRILEGGAALEPLSGAGYTGLARTVAVQVHQNAAYGASERLREWRGQQHRVVLVHLGPGEGRGRRGGGAHARGRLGGQCRARQRGCGGTVLALAPGVLARRRLFNSWHSAAQAWAPRHHRRCDGLTKHAARRL